MNKRGYAILAASFLPFAARAGDLGAKTPAPDDLGPSVIEVSSYPEEHQKTYRDVFVPVFKAHGGTARAISSPLIELDAHLEEQERRDNPGLFQDAEVAQVSRDGWKKLVQTLYRTPGCCGACPALTLTKARALWRFLVYDSIRRKTGRQAASWIAARKDLLARFRRRQTMTTETGK